MKVVSTDRGTRALRSLERPTCRTGRGLGGQPIECGVGPREFGPPTVGRHAAGRVDERTAGRRAAKLEVVEGGAQFEQRCAVAPRQGKRRIEVDLAGS